MAIIKLSATERRRLSAFFTCLMLAIFAWIFTVLSNPYKYSVKIALIFKNGPQKRAFHSLQPDTVNVNLTGNGWDMLFSKMNAENKSIPVDISSLENRSYIVLSSQLDQINSKKSFDQQITGFSPDTLYFDFSNRKVKRVPINVISAIHYQHQFSQSGNVANSPAYAVVTGPENVINKITSWNTDSLKLDSVSETVTTRIGLQPVTEGNMSVYPKTIRVSIPVDEFTEKTLFLPVKLINNRNFDNVKVFPQKVKITFTIPLSRYAEIDEDYFEATADMDQWRLHNFKVLPVEVKRIPPFCRIVKIEPRNIDFIVRR